MIFALFAGNNGTIRGNNKLESAESRRNTGLFRYYNTTYANIKEKFSTIHNFLGNMKKIFEQIENSAFCLYKIGKLCYNL